MSIALRVAGFGILILLIILVPIYKIFSISYQFWIAVVACSLSIYWAFVAYRKLYSVIACPKCGFRLKYQQLRKTGVCPRCNRDLQSLLDM